MKYLLRSRGGKWEEIKTRTKNGVKKIIKTKVKAEADTQERRGLQNRFT